MKVFKHFPHPQIVLDLLSEIKTRHQNKYGDNPYQGIIETSVAQIKAYFERQFPQNQAMFDKKMTIDEIVAKYQANRTFAETIQHRYAVSEHKRVLNMLQEQVNL